MADPETRYLYRAEREIAAPAELAWAALVDFDAYPQWNPFTPYVESDRVAGRPIVLYVDFALRWPARERATLLRQVETIRRFAPGEALVWSYAIGHARLFYGERWQQIEVLAADRCRYVTHERFTGAIAWLVDALYGSKVQRGFDAVADALARRVESCYRRP
jgi:hypothetical protein